MKLWFERGAWASKRGREVISVMSPESVRRIAVIRHAALGDMILVRPFLVEARKFFPRAEIVLSTVSNYTYGTPEDLVDSVHILNGNDQPHISLSQTLSRARDLGPADILFDLADTTRSRYLTLLSEAKLKIGFPYRWYLRNLLFDAAVLRSDFVFEAEVMLDTLRLFGANPASPLNFGWSGYFTQTPRNIVFPKTVVYFPFASVQSKCWSRSNFMELISRLAAEFPHYSHVVLGGTSPQENLSYFEELEKKFANVTLRQATGLESTIPFLSSVALVISNDTGLRNLAISTGTKTLGIFFSTVPYRYWPRWGNQHETLFSPDGSPPTVEQVIAKAQILLSEIA